MYNTFIRKIIKSYNSKTFALKGVLILLLLLNLVYLVIEIKILCHLEAVILKNIKILAAI